MADRMVRGPKQTREETIMDSTMKNLTVSVSAAVVALVVTWAMAWSFVDSTRYARIAGTGTSTQLAQASVAALLE
jgi:hypothetical protein